MKLKILLIVVFSVILKFASAQPLNWTEDSPAEFAPITITGEFDMVTEGSSAVNIIFTETGTPYFISEVFDVTANTDFSFSIDILDNDPGAEINQRVRFLNSNGDGTNLTSSVYSTDNADYQTYTFTGTSTADAVKAYVIIRIYDVAAAWTGSAAFKMDNASYTEGAGTNLILNGGFENWATPDIPDGSTLMDWMESSPAEFLPITIEPEVSSVSHGLVAAKITFTETGTPYFVSDTFDVTANTDFDFSIDILDNDAGAEINQRIRFIDNTGAGTNSTSGTYSTDDASYQTYSFTGTSPANAEKAYLIIRMYDVAAAWTGSAVFYLDNARYTEGGTSSIPIPNGSFENWLLPTGNPEFVSFKFEGLDPVVNGIINKIDYTISLTVPYSTDLTTLVSTFELGENTTAKVGDVDQVSGTTANDFSSPVVYSLSSGDLMQDWTVTVSKEAPSTGKDIISFRFEDLNSPVNGTVSAANHTVDVEVPSGTAITALVPTLVISTNATVSPESGVAQDFSSAVTYTVTAQDGLTQDWVVNVSVASAGKTTLFSEDFEGIGKIPEGWVIINHDGYTQAAGEEAWQDSAWTVTTSNRIELAGTNVAMASSYCSDMPLEGAADDWLILPLVSILENTTLSWQAMSTTSSGNYPDDYMVLIAPAISGGTPTFDYFKEESNILLEVKPENWSASVGRPGDGLASRSINLKNAITESAADGWYNRDVWIAFRLTTDRYTNPDTGIPNSTAGGSNLAIDNILIVNDVSTGIETLSDAKNALSVYPNPSSGQVSINLNVNSSALADLSIIDLTGRKVLNTSRFMEAGQNTIELNLSDLKKGLYFVKISADGVNNVSKLILK